MNLFSIIKIHFKEQVDQKLFFYGQFSMKFPFSMKLPFYRMILSKIKDTTT